MIAPTADKAIVAQVKRVDPTLSVAWVDPPGRWGVFHDLQVPGNLERTVDEVARALQIEAAARGYILDLAECAFSALEAVKDAKLVFYVAEEEDMPDGRKKGDYRPLDGRVVTKLQRMDYWRRNLDLRDWREMMRAKADEQRDRRLRAEGDVWDTIRRDSVFARVASDILWGVKPTRSVTVPDQLVNATLAKLDKEKAA